MVVHNRVSGTYVFTEYTIVSLKRRWSRIKVGIGKAIACALADALAHALIPHNKYHIHMHPKYRRSIGVAVGFSRVEYSYARGESGKPGDRNGRLLVCVCVPNKIHRH